MQTQYQSRSVLRFLDVYKRQTSGLAAAYILGVPGIYNTNEQFMAAMFGFAYFKPGRLSKEYTFSGKTGYWYRPLEHV